MQPHVACSAREDLGDKGTSIFPRSVPTFEDLQIQGSMHREAGRKEESNTVLATSSS